jgi:DNA polymerase-1
MSAFGLAQRLGIHPGVAGEYIDLYFSRYARVREYIDRSLETARSEGYVRTLFGRRRYVPNLGSKNRMMRMAAERIAINAPIQGTAADLMKLAMIRVQERMDREEREAILLLQVHDEIVIEVPEPETEAIASLVREEMEKVHPLRVPLRVEVGTGRNWAELK